MPEPGEAFARHRTAHSRTARYCVAYSGGRDSHALLHLVERSLRDDPAIALRALHIDHGLSPDSARWADHCRTVCERLGVTLAVRRVDVRPDGHGPEAAARAARHGAFADELGVGEHLLLAHHAHDQAETFLLRALRGSGPDGLAAMPALRPFARGCLARPLLECSTRGDRRPPTEIPPVASACGIDLDPIDVVVSDPARPGLAKPGVAALKRMDAPVVVLVSCDPASLARDARLLADAGYRAESVEVLDLFPQTPHVECVTRFVRA